VRGTCPRYVALTAGGEGAAAVAGGAQVGALDRIVGRGNQGGDRQPGVEAARFTDLPAAVEDRTDLAFDRVADAIVDRGQAAHRQRLVPRARKALRPGPRAQGVGRLGAHPHRASGRADQPEFAQRGEKGGLALGRPAVVAAAGEGDGGEVGCVDGNVHRRAYA